MSPHLYPCPRCFLLPPDPHEVSPRYRSGVCRCRPTELEVARMRGEAKRRFERRWGSANEWWRAA